MVPVCEIKKLRPASGQPSYCTAISKIAAPIRYAVGVVDAAVRCRLVRTGTAVFGDVNLLDAP